MTHRDFGMRTKLKCKSNLVFYIVLKVKKGHQFRTILVVFEMLLKNLNLYDGQVSLYMTF